MAVWTEKLESCRRIPCANFSQNWYSSLLAFREETFKKLKNETNSPFSISLRPQVSSDLCSHGFTVAGLFLGCPYPGMVLPSHLIRKRPFELLHQGLSPCFQKFPPTEDWITNVFKKVFFMSLWELQLLFSFFPFFQDIDHLLFVANWMNKNKFKASYKEDSPYLKDIFIHTKPTRGWPSFIPRFHDTGKHFLSLGR